MQRRQRIDKIGPTRKYSSKQEKEVASKFSGLQTLNSGATPYQKSDVLLDKWALECKTKISDSKSISIQEEWLDKNEKESLYMGKPYSALVFNFGPNKKNYYIIDEYLFKDLVEYLENRLSS